jgi:hypothetical protein
VNHDTVTAATPISRESKNDPPRDRVRHDRNSRAR